MTYEVITRVIHDTSGQRSMGEITNRPAPTITVGVNSINSNHFKVEICRTDKPPPALAPPPGKPPYRVPLMAEVRQQERNGYTVASTFSGGGGSCTGYYMAGYTVAYANEFIEEARNTYAANHPKTYLDPRDIRTVTPESILEILNLKPGELDLFDGSPPCSAFSTAGKREKGWGKAKAYSDSAVQVVDDLFFEYARLLRGLQPKVFIAENVSGLVKGSAKGYFKLILKELRACGYRVEARLLNAAWLGVPQARERLIFIGVREDLGLPPAFPKPLPYQYTVRDALPWVILQADNAGFGQGSMREATRASPTIGASPKTGNGRFPASLIEAEISTPEEKAAVGLGHYKIGQKWDALAPGESLYYGGGLVRPDPERPCPTMTATGGHLSASSVTRPTERRKFTIPELKRICAFPDDYILTGTYAQQWERCGRSVPPVMMCAIAETVRRDILDRIET